MRLVDQGTSAGAVREAAPEVALSRVLVVHRQRAFAEALAVRLSREAAFEVVGAVTRPEPALALVSSQHVQVVVLDWSLGDAAAPDVAARVLALEQPPALVVLSGDDEPEPVIEVLRAGALAWVPGSAPVDTLLEALQRAAAREAWLPAWLLGPVLTRLLSQPVDAGRGALDALTDREIDVLRCMVAGLDQAAIARRLFLSPNTVRTHRRRTLAKLGVHSSLEAVAVARRAGLAPQESVQLSSGSRRLSPSTPL